MARWGLAVLVLALLGGGGAGAVEITDFAAYSQGNLKITGTVEGDVGSGGGNVKLQGDTLVTGDVLAAGQVSASRNVVVQGTITPQMQPVQGLATAVPGLPTLPSSLPPFTSAGSGGPSFKGKYKELALDPGNYGSVKVQGTKEGGSLLLSSGEYHFDALTAKKINFRFDVSKGPVTIYVDGKMSLGKGVNVFVATSNGQFLSLEEAGQNLAGLVYAEAGSMVRINGSEWAGTLYTPDGKLLVKKSTIDGALYSGGSIKVAGSTLGYSPLDLNGSFVLYPGDRLPPADKLYIPTPTAMLPEPSTLSLLGSLLSGLLLWRGRRLRRAGRPA